MEPYWHQFIWHQVIWSHTGKDCIIWASQAVPGGCVTVDKVLKYSLTAADILQNPALYSRDIVASMDGCLEAIRFEDDTPLEPVSWCPVFVS
jgi:hypothetical protein